MNGDATQKLGLNKLPNKNGITNGSGGGQDLHGYQETDEDRDFLALTDMIDMDRTFLESALEKFDETSFDAFTYCTILTTHSL